MYRRHRGPRSGNQSQAKDLHVGVKFSKRRDQCYTQRRHGGVGYKGLPGPDLRAEEEDRKHKKYDN